MVYSKNVAIYISIPIAMILALAVNAKASDNARFNSKLRRMDIQRAGQKIEIGHVVTKTLVILAGQIATNPGEFRVFAHPDD